MSRFFKIRVPRRTRACSGKPRQKRQKYFAKWLLPPLAMVGLHNAQATDGCYHSAYTPDVAALSELALGANNKECVTFPYLSKYSNPNANLPDYHAGIDFRSNGVATYSIVEGTVVDANAGAGRVTIEAEHEGSSVKVIYLHLSRINVSRGDYVVPGKQLGLTGDVGSPGHPHLHLEVRRNYSGVLGVGAVSCADGDCNTRSEVEALTIPPETLLKKQCQNDWFKSGGPLEKTGDLVRNYFNENVIFRNQRLDQIDYCKLNNRYEGLATLVRALEAPNLGEQGILSNNVNASTFFTDLNEPSWLANSSEVQKAFAADIVSPQPDRQFDPFRSIDRISMLAFSVRAYENFCRTIDTQGVQIPFNDVAADSSLWWVAEKIVQKGFAQGLISGHDKFRPNDIVPAHETIHFVDKLVKQLNQCATKQGKLKVSNYGRGINSDDDLVSVNPEGADCGANERQCYLYGQTTDVTLNANPPAGYEFDKWLGECASSNSATCRTTVDTDDNLQVGAEFKLSEEPIGKLQVSVSGALNTGALSISPQGESCGISCFTYTQDTEVIIRANAAASYIFDEWIGGQCKQQASSVCKLVVQTGQTAFETATFVKEALPDVGTLNVDVFGAGAVAISPQGSECGEDCYTYNTDTVVTIQATPDDSEYIFEQWIGGTCDGQTTASCQVDVRVGQTYREHPLFVKPKQAVTDYTKPSSWVEATIDNDYRVYDSVYAQGFYLVVGTDNSLHGNGLILSSDDGETWSRVAVPNLDNITFHSIAYNAADWVAVGTNTRSDVGYIFHSEDSKTWTRVHSTQDAVINSVHYGGDKWIAVGDDNFLKYSSNGEDWQDVILIGNGQGYNFDFQGVTYNSGKWVAVSDSGTNYSQIATSTDGRTWHQSDFNEKAHQLQDVASNGNQFVAVGYQRPGSYVEPVILISDDGTAWENVSPPNSRQLSLFGVTAVSNGWVIATGQQKIATSSDGRNWEFYESNIGFGHVKLNYVANQNALLATNKRDIFKAEPLITYTLNVQVGGNGSVFFDGKFCPGECSGEYADGSELRVVVDDVPDRWVFSEWGGHCSSTNRCDLKINSSQLVTATFLPDHDGDGIDNGNDPDDDGDGVPDVDDAFPLDQSESVDTDRDGQGNNADRNDDNDNALDNVDVFPLDPSESVDTDGDGIGNNADTDDDGDNLPDHYENQYDFLNPLDSSDASLDEDNDGNSNLDEFQNNTDPSVSDLITSPVNPPIPLLSEVQWEGISGFIGVLSDNDQTITVTVPEDVGSLEVTAIRSGNADLPVNTGYSITSETASPDLDFTGEDGNLIWPIGSTHQRFIIDIIDDSERETSDERFSISLASPLFPGTLGQLSTLVIVIEDNDGDAQPPSTPDTPVVKFGGVVGYPSIIEGNEQSITLSENAGELTINIVREGNVDLPVSVGYAFADAVGSNVAIRGQDYTGEHGTLDFAAGQTVQSFNINIIDDINEETSEETIVINLNNSFLSQLGFPSVLEIIIQDNDDNDVLCASDAGSRGVEFGLDGQTRPKGCFINIVNGEPVPSISPYLFNEQDASNALIRLIPDSSHQGQSADIWSVRLFIAPGAQHVAWEWQDSDGNWHPWDRTFTSLGAFAQGPLTTIDIPTHQRSLTGLAGNHIYFAGYQLDNNVIVVNFEQWQTWQVTPSVSCPNGGQAGALLPTTPSLTLADANDITFSSAGERAASCFIDHLDGLSATTPLLINDGKAHDMHIQIDVAASHQGRLADMFFVVLYASLGQEPVSLYIDASGTLHGWNGSFNELGAIKQTRLAAQEVIPLFSGTLSSAFAGDYTIYVGYQLEDGTLVINSPR